MSIINSTSAKLASVAFAAITATGCASLGDGLPRGYGTAGGAVAGAAAANAIGGNGAVTILGGVAGAILGRSLEAPCETRTTGSVSSTVNGQQNSPWSGRKTHSFDCRGTSSLPNQNLPGNIPGAGPNAPKPVFR